MVGDIYGFSHTFLSLAGVVLGQLTEIDQNKLISIHPNT